MSGMRMTLNEIGRLFRSKRTWLFIVILSVIPAVLSTDAFGLGTRYFTGTMSDVLMLEPARLAVFACAFIALFLTLLEMQRMTKFRMNTIVESVTNPTLNHLRQTIAVILAVCCSMLISLCVMLPYTAALMGGVFSLKAFLTCWVVLYLGGIVITVLFASGLFMLTGNFEISFLIVGILILFSQFNDGVDKNFLYAWLQTNVFYFSDQTGGQLSIDFITYNRAVWLPAALGVYLLGLACVRKYGQNVFFTFLQSCKKAVLPLLFAALIASGGFLFADQPYIDNGPYLKSKTTVDPKTGLVSVNTDYSSEMVDNSMNAAVHIVSGQADITVDTQKRRLSGVAVYCVSNPSGQRQDLSLNMEPGLNITDVTESPGNTDQNQTAAQKNSVKVSFKKDKKDNFQASVYHLELTPEKTATLRVAYAGSPRNRKDYQLDTAGITDEYVFVEQLYPRFNADAQAIACTLTLPEKLTPFMPSTELTQTAAKRKGYRAYTFTSAPGQWLIAGDYVVDNLKAGGMDVKFAYFKKAAQIMRQNHAPQQVANIVNFFTREFGPLQFHGQPFIIAELDDSSGGGWETENMSIFGESMFVGDQYKADPALANQEGGSGLGVAVHEIAHQWWGGGPSSVQMEEDGHSPWSPEGLACYSTYLYFKQYFGAAYAKQAFTDSWALKTEKMQNAFYNRNLQYIGRLSTQDAAAIYQSYAADTQYDEMPDLLMKAAKLSGGENAFVKKLSGLYQAYSGKTLSYDGFLSYMHLKKGEMTVG
jgi:Aminopeptidase N